MRLGLLCVSYIFNARQLILAEATLKSIKTEHQLLKLCVINGGDNTDFAYNNFDIVMENENCLAKAWNMGIKRLLELGCDYIIISNLDVVLQDSVDNLIKFAQEKKDGVMWTGKCINTVKPTSEVIDHINCWDHFSFFMVDKTFFERVGMFDENYRRAYFEDVDMIWRIHLLHEIAYCCPTCGFLHHGQTTSRDNNGTLLANMPIDNNKEYFLRKWNDVRGGKGYEFPFNDSSIPIKWILEVEKIKTID